MTLARFAVIAACLACAALMAAGCGGNGSELPAEEWADAFCTATNDWTDDLQRITDDLANPDNLSVDAVKDAAQEAADETDAYVAELRDLGRPDTASGDEVEASVEELADTVEAERSEIEAQIDGISGIQDLVAGIGAIGSSVGAMFTALAGTIQAIEDADVEGELRTAFEQTESCDELTD